MKYTNIILALLTALLLYSCSKEADTVHETVIPENVDLTWKEPSPEELDQIGGSFATVKGFECGDEITRSTWIFNSQKFIFGWNHGDGVGVLPTAQVAKESTAEAWDNTNPSLVMPTEDPSTTHPQYTQENRLCIMKPDRAQIIPFFVGASSEGSQTAQLFGDMGEYEWDDQVRWSAFFPYSIISKSPTQLHYDHIPFVYESDNFIQKQNGIPDIAAYFKDGVESPESPDYVRTEAQACKHLGDVDVMISSEMVWSGSRINFQLRHVGAVARFYLAAPKNENLVVTNLKLICDKEIFYKEGYFTLKSHPYKQDESHNYGVDLIGDDDTQVVPDETKKTKMLQIDFVDGSAKTVYDEVNAFKRYVTAYMMMFPITYDSTKHGNLYAYVTAYRQGDQEKKELHFVSNPLENKTMVSGKYYQWTSATKLQDGLYPIELTATLLPWQDIVGGNINTDLTK